MTRSEEGVKEKNGKGMTMFTEIKVVELFEKVTQDMESNLKETEAKGSDNLTEDDKVFLGMLFGMLLILTRVLELDDEMKAVLSHIESAVKINNAIDSMKKGMA